MLWKMSIFEIFTTDIYVIIMYFNFVYSEI